MAISIVPAASGFYALFLNPKDLGIPRQFFKHAVVAWQVTQTATSNDDLVYAWPVCIGEDAWRYDFILSPDGTLEHATGFTTNNENEALSFALHQEDMHQEDMRRSMPPAAE